MATTASDQWLAHSRDDRAGPRRARFATTLLGVLLLAEGTGKLLAPLSYFAALGRFRAFDASAATVVGTAWIAAELSSGAGLLAAGLATTPPLRLARVAAVGALALQLAYAALSTQAYARGLHVDNCTCFGVFLAQRLSWFVLLQDAYMIFFAGWQLRKIIRWQTVAEGERA